MTDTMSKALEAALVAMSEVDASSRGEAEARRCLEAAIPAYLAHLVEDEAVVERVKAAIEKERSDMFAVYGADARMFDLLELYAKAALRSLAGKE